MTLGPPRVARCSGHTRSHLGCSPGAVWSPSCALRWLRLEERGPGHSQLDLYDGVPIPIGTPAAAVGAASGIVLISDLVSRKGPAKVIFNTSQIVVVHDASAPQPSLGRRPERGTAGPGVGLQYFGSLLTLWRRARSFLVSTMRSPGASWLWTKGSSVVPMLRQHRYGEPGD